MEDMLGLQRRDPDRLLPADPDLRAIARDLYDRVAGRPILSPHGHVPAEPRPRPGARARGATPRALYAGGGGRPLLPPHAHVPAELLALDTPFGDPAELFVVRDHYVTRLLHAAGVGLDELGLGTGQ